MSKVEFKERKICIDGKAVQIFSGAIHYFRVHPDLWRDRLEKLALCGFNCVETYMCWNLHEPQEGNFDFSGMLDLPRFIRTAQELGLYVILRPGPYICAEWDNGGFPYWLMLKEGIEFRRNNKVCLECIQRYFDRIMPLLKQLQYDCGGPVIAMQIENEHGSYGRDDAYIGALRDMMRKAGITVPLFTADGIRNMRNGMLEGTPAMLTGSGRALAGFGTLRALRPDDVPFFVELWAGWYDHWKDNPRNGRNAAGVAEEFDDIIRSGSSVNMYMFHGGTNFGFHAGANRTRLEVPYICDTTSYDYDAPITEWGDVTEKYFLLQKTVKKYFPEAKTGTPAPVKRRAYGKIDFTGSIPFFAALEHLATPVRSDSPLTMEKLGQAFGFVHYRTRIPGPRKVQLRAPEVHDCADIFIDGRRLATVFRDDKPFRFDVDIPTAGVTLDILVESFGRINYGYLTGLDFKGLPGGVMTDNAWCFGWKNYSLPLDEPRKLPFGPVDPILPCPGFFKGEFEADEVAETFIRFPGVRGAVWVNGFNLGRYWRVGSADTLYVPSPILRKGRNEIIVFETEQLLRPYAVSVEKAVL